MIWLWILVREPYFFICAHEHVCEGQDRTVRLICSLLLFSFLVYSFYLTPPLCSFFFCFRSFLLHFQMCLNDLDWTGLNVTAHYWMETWSCPIAQKSYSADRKCPILKRRHYHCSSLLTHVYTIILIISLKTIWPCSHRCACFSSFRECLPLVRCRNGRREGWTSHVAWEIRDHFLI